MTKKKIPFSSMFQEVPQTKRTAFALRLVAFILIIALTLVLTVGPTASPGKIYAHRLDFTHYNVGRGLYNALADTANTVSFSDDPFSPGFTTSEIEVLVQYTSEQFGDSPQFIVSGLWKYCYGTFDSYNLTNENFNLNIDESLFTNASILGCSTPPDYYFNYRALLGQVGMTIVLEYAYNGDYESNQNYIHLMDSVRRGTHMFKTCLQFASISSLVQFVTLFIIYGILVKVKKNNPLATYLEHFCGLLSVAMLVAMGVASVSFTIVSLELRDRVTEELGDYGISLHLGSIWFSNFWVTFALFFYNFCVWGGVTWFTVPEEDRPSSDRYYRHNQRMSLNTISGFTNTTPIPQALDGKFDELEFINEGTSNVTRLDSLHYSTNSSRGTKTVKLSFKKMFKGSESQTPRSNTTLGTRNGPALRDPFRDSSDATSMVSASDPYTNDVNYDQILSNDIGYSGYGLHKNGTIKHNLLLPQSEPEAPSQNDIEMEFQRR